MKMLVTDLDNTLYDWVTYFSLSFHAMVKELSRILSISEDELLADYKSVHQKFGNTEQPFAVLELDIIKDKFKGYSSSEILSSIDPALYAFNHTRVKTLKLYESVKSTLDILNKNKILIVGHTEAIFENAFYRLKKLDIDQYFTRLYCLEGNYSGHPNPKNSTNLATPADFLQIVPKSERKPNPALLLDICSREKIDLRDVWYVGDSLTRDIGMAKNAGVKSIWAKYGTKYDKNLWDYLVRVTHWTEEDVLREKMIKEKFKDVKPDFEINRFSEIESIIIKSN